MIPDRTYCWSRRWQVWYRGYRWGMSAQGTPVRNTHRMPFKTASRSFHGRRVHLCEVSASDKIVQDFSLCVGEYAQVDELVVMVLRIPLLGDQPGRNGHSHEQCDSN